MTIGKKILLMFFGVMTLSLLAVGAYLFTAYNFSTQELSKTFKDYRGGVTSTAIVDTKPFSILLMGVDTGKGERVDQWQGQSDSMILVTVNPETKTTTLTSLERDILVDIYDEHGEPTGTQTKLNAAYAYGGAPMAIKTVEGLLDLKIDYYMQINMQGLVDLVDAVGGITVTNAFDFPIRIDEWEPEYTSSVPPGTHKVNGEQALVFARMRYDDPEGDYGRQRRQREVIQKILHQLLGLNGLASHQRILQAVAKNMQTDIALTRETLPKLLAYKDAIANLQTYQLHGQDVMLDETSYQAVTAEHLLETQNRIKRELGLAETVELTTTAMLYEQLTGEEPPQLEIMTEIGDSYMPVYEPVQPETEEFAPEAAPATEETVATSTDQTNLSSPVSTPEATNSNTATAPLSLIHI